MAKAYLPFRFLGGHGVPHPIEAKARDLLDGFPYSIVQT
jgi:hypothetical protein